MTGEPIQPRDSAVPTLAGVIAGAPDPTIARIVALVDAMTRRGPADLLIEPLRQRLATLRPPRPLRFGRLMFCPLDPLIVPRARWRPGQPAIPRTALMAMAEQVRLTMGAPATSIETRIAGRTTADVELISRLGRSLWPAAAGILAGTPIPQTWDATGLGDVNYRPLADAVAALLAQAATIDTLCTEAATGLLPPPPEAINTVIGRVARVNPAALPMIIAVLLDRLPQAAELLAAAHTGPDGAHTRTAIDEATDLLLRNLDQHDGTEARIATGTLADAAAAASRIAALLKHLDTPNARPRRRDRLRALRQRLDAECKARFAAALENELLAPLQRMGIAPAPAEITALEAAARGLRVLETTARAVGSGATYDLLLGNAAEAIKGSAMRNRLSRADQLRLVEILSGSDAALAMLVQPA